MTGNVAKIVINLLVIIAALLGVLAIFGALSTEEAGDNLVKLVGVGLIAIVATAVINIVNK